MRWNSIFDGKLYLPKVINTHAKHAGPLIWMFTLCNSSIIECTCHNITLFHVQTIHILLWNTVLWEIYKSFCGAVVLKKELFTPIWLMAVFTLMSKDLLSFAWQIARGMAYLASVRVSHLSFVVEVLGKSIGPADP